MSSGEQGRVLLGCQGWRYPHWRQSPAQEDLESAPEFAPPGLEAFAEDLRAPFYQKAIQQRDELKHYSRTFEAVEVDSTFYAIPKREWVRAWGRAVGDDFRFALKLPRILTHDYALQRGRGSLNEFCATAAELGHKLTAILIQLPATFTPEFTDVLERFLPHLPRELDFAVEFRDPGWITERTRDLLARHGVAFMLGPTPWLGTDVSLPLLGALPTDWLYIRFMGDRDEMPFTHLQIDRESELDLWAGEIRKLSAAGKRVIALLDNHYQGFSPGSARLLARRLGIELGPYPRDQQIGDQMKLF